MATVTTAVSAPRPKWLRRVRTIGWILLAIGVFALVTFAWAYFTVRSALPKLEGTVQVPGLSAQVTISRDQHGVPTIESSNLRDLFFAQGYVTAQDRLWQMDATRRFAAGELAEIIGSDLLQHDRRQRILGLRMAARKSLEIAPPDERARFEAYAQGVNAYIGSHWKHLPMEFRMLGYGPKAWLPEDSFLIAAQMVDDLSTKPQHALDREKILARLGPELTNDLYVNTSWHDRPPTVARPTLKEDVGTGDDGDTNEDQDEETGPDRSVAKVVRFSSPEIGLYRKAMPASWFLGMGLGGWEPNFSSVDEWELTDPPMKIGSNNWVVSGAHTVTGKPLLSNDMHLGHQMPNIWYVAHLRCGDLDVAGMTLPGLPYVIAGHNQRIAWGFTNIAPTVEDPFIENFNGNGQYQTPEGWKDPEHRWEVVRIKDKPDVVLDVVTTRHGPIITELVPGESRPIALRWTLYDGMHNPFFEVDRAQNWEQFRRALSQFDVPGQNVVYADVDGNIGYQATGKVPIRTAGDGSLPVNGSDNAHEWKGYIPFDKLPNVYNPPWGAIATANGRITPNGYPYSVSVEWEAPWRTARIYKVLESGKKFSAADMLSLETDIFSEVDRYFAERFVYAVDHVKTASARAKQAADILRQWDGRMSAGSAAPSIEVRSRGELTRLLLEPKLGPAPKGPHPPGTMDWTTYSWGLQSVWLENVMQRQPARWLPSAYQNYEELLTAAVEAALNQPDAPKNLGSWDWGAVNAIFIQNPVVGKIPGIRKWAGPGLQKQSGSPYTVKAVSPNHGPSERMTVDLSSLDQSTLNLVTGEAGGFLSPYYMDQWKAWYDGTTFPWPYSKPAVGKAQRHQLILAP